MNSLFAFCTDHRILVMFWIPKYNKKSHNNCFIIYRQWFIDLTKLKTQSISNLSSSAKMFFLELVLHGTGSSELFGTKKCGSNSPIKIVLLIEYHLHQTHNPNPFAAPSGLEKLTDQTTLWGWWCQDCNDDKISVCKSLLLLEWNNFRLYAVKGSASAGFKLESRPLLVPLWPNPPI